MRLFNYSGFDPVTALLRLQRDLEAAFEKPLGFDGLSGRGLFPPVNVFADKEGYVLRFEVPGIAPENVEVQTRGHTLTVSGKREPSAPQGASLHRTERGTGAFARSIELSDELDLERATATHQNGLLTIRVPKREETKPRQIAVKAA
jgi:HSP20 family protein